MVVALFVGNSFSFGWWWRLSFRGEREMSSFVFILLSNLYYFIKLYLKIRIWMLGLLLNELIQLIK